MGGDDRRPRAAAHMGEMIGRARTATNGRCGDAGKRDFLAFVRLKMIISLYCVYVVESYFVVFKFNIQNKKAEVLNYS